MMVTLVHRIKLKSITGMLMSNNDASFIYQVSDYTHFQLSGRVKYCNVKSSCISNMTRLVVDEN